MANWGMWNEHGVEMQGKWNEKGGSERSKASFENAINGTIGVWGGWLFSAKCVLPPSAPLLHCFNQLWM